MVPMNVVLLSTYELGRQPFGLASPAAWLRRVGAEVSCFDLSREQLRPDEVGRADLMAVYLPMHTATRLATRLVPRLKALNPTAKLCFYGLYAPMNEQYLRRLGADAVLGGEFEQGLADLAQSLDDGRESAAPAISLGRQQFLIPDRTLLPPLERYAKLNLPAGESRTVGYTEASRGCKHLCRHCPIVPVYNGTFRIVQQQVVLEDIRRQVAAGAEHITFGDPDFFNGPRHAIELVEALHREFPGITYDVTIKVEHLLKQAWHLATLRRTGCLFVTSAVESFDNHVLERLDKGHTREDLFQVVELFRQADLTLAPTFVPFTPWTSLASFQQFLATLVDLDLVAQVAPIQLAIRLLIPAGSRLLELAEVSQAVGPFDAEALYYPWQNADPRIDRLCDEIRRAVTAGERRHQTRGEIFEQVWELAFGAPPVGKRWSSGAAVPHVEEPWYCCAEPTEEQFAVL